MKIFSNLVLVAVLLTSSCSLQKRRYTDGYYFSHKTKNKTETIHEKKTKEHSISSSGKTIVPVISANPLPDKNLNYVASGYNYYSPQKVQVLEECDLIVFKNGQEIKCKVSEITLYEIKYIKCDNLNGPVTSVSKKDVAVIKYSNGTEDVINVTDVAKPQEVKNNNTPVTSAEKKTSGFAVTGFVLSMLAIISIIVGASGGLFSILGLIFSVIGFIKIRKNPDKYKGKGLAKAGIIISLLCFAYFIIYLITIT